ncbi:MAG: hypothetical protein ABSE93_08940 [Terriglobia bacterium]
MGRKRWHPAARDASSSPPACLPFTYTGPPQELDAELGKLLASYVQTHTQTANCITQSVKGQLIHGTIRHGHQMVKLQRIRHRSKEKRIELFSFFPGKLSSRDFGEKV